MITQSRLHVSISRLPTHTTTGCSGQTSGKTFLAFSILSIWHFQHVAMVQLMSVHFQHVVEHTTAGRGTRYAKAIGGIGPLSCPSSLIFN